MICAFRFFYNSLNPLHGGIAFIDALMTSKAMPYSQNKYILHQRSISGMWGACLLEMRIYPIKLIYASQSRYILSLPSHYWYILINKLKYVYVLFTLQSYLCAFFSHLKMELIQLWSIFISRNNLRRKLFLVIKSFHNWLIWLTEHPQRNKIWYQYNLIVL